MRPREYSRWVDPAPLEVERPRLPWWTLLPRKLLVAASPVIVLVLLGWLALFTARKLWRYPLALVSAAVAAGLGVGWSWWVPVAVFGGLGAVLGLWAWAHRDSFHRSVVRQVRSEWRRVRVYAFGWKRTMQFCDLTKRTGHTVHYPRIRRVRADGWRDRVSVKLLPGQSPSAYAARAEELAHSFGARSCRVRADRPPGMCSSRGPRTRVSRRWRGRCCGRWPWASGSGWCRWSGSTPKTAWNWAAHPAPSTGWCRQRRRGRRTAGAGCHADPAAG
jgi:hypothetical protein